MKAKPAEKKSTAATCKTIFFNSFMLIKDPGIPERRTPPSDSEVYLTYRRLLRII
jgi:hypothetical protein